MALLRPESSLILGSWAAEVEGRMESGIAAKVSVDDPSPAVSASLPIGR